MPDHRRSLRATDKQPRAFFQELANLCVDMPSNRVFDKETQNKILANLQQTRTVTIKFPRSKQHQNLNAPKGYFSSSWDANNDEFNPQQGGCGPPQCVNGSFSHHHTDASFQFLHPNVDPDTYGMSTPPRGNEPEPAREYRSDTPQPETPEPAHLPSSPPATPLAPSAATLLDEVIDVSAAEQDQAEVDTAPVATISPGTAGAGQDDVVVEVSSHDFACPAAAETKLASAEDVDDNDDSGIVLHDTAMSDTEDFIDDATFADTSNVACASQSVDSAYGTQPSQEAHDTIPDMDVSVTDGTCFTGNSLTKSSSPSDVRDNGTASQPSEQSRKKLTPKQPRTTRRSTRLSQMELAPPSLEAAPASSLGKHERKADADIDTTVEEPKAKRTKATRP